MKLDVRTRHIPFTARFFELAERRLQSALGRVAHVVGRIILRVDDINGPRGGIDTSCLAVVELKPHGSLVIRGSYASPGAAVNAIFDRVAAHVQRHRERSIAQQHGR